MSTSTEEGGVFGATAAAVDVVVAVAAEAASRSLAARDSMDCLKMAETSPMHLGRRGEEKKG